MILWETMSTQRGYQAFITLIHRSFWALERGGQQDAMCFLTWCSMKDTNRAHGAFQLKLLNCFCKRISSQINIGGKIFCRTTNTASLASQCHDKKHCSGLTNLKQHNIKIQCMGLDWFQQTNGKTIWGMWDMDWLLEEIKLYWCGKVNIFTNHWVRKCNLQSIMHYMMHYDHFLGGRDKIVCFYLILAYVILLIFYNIHILLL